VNGPVLLDAYFQDPYWYETGAQQVVERLMYAAEGLLISSLDVDRTAVFIRHGDYPNAWRLPDSYYREAVQRALRGGASQFDVISSDAAAVPLFERLVRQLDSVAVVEWQPRAPLDDLVFGARHTSVILANSTFAWWAARLGEAAGYTLSDRVFGPRPWLPGHDTRLLRDSWRVVPHQWGS
jgi:hypothetical protein